MCLNILFAIMLIIFLLLFLALCRVYWLGLGLAVHPSLSCTCSLYTIHATCMQVEFSFASALHVWVLGKL